MLAFRPDPVLVRECLGVLDEADLDAAGRVHFSTDDLRCLVASLAGVGPEPHHGVDVGATQTALPMVRSVRPNVAHLAGTAPHSYAKGLWEAVERFLRKAQRLQPFMGE